MRRQRYRIGTGFLTTWRVLDALTQYGYLDTAYGMLENTERPGWLYAVTRGATTVWENWYGLDDKNVPRDSHNHYAPGAAAAWLFSTCAGIRPLEPGFSRILIQPRPGGSLTWAKAECSSPQGIIGSSWTVEKEQFVLSVEVPEGIPCTVALPNGEERVVTGGKHSFTCAL